MMPVIPNIYAYLIAGVVFFAIVGGAFGYGYYTATGQYEAALLSQSQAITMAVHEKDAAIHDAAVKSGQLIEARRRQGDAAVKAVMDAITALPMPVTQACEFTPEALHLLNEAGRK